VLLNRLLCDHNLLTSHRTDRRTDRRTSYFGSRLTV